LLLITYSTVSLRLHRSRDRTLEYCILMEID
jgi:hypothetical protein